MIESIMRDCLAAKLDVPVYTEYPESAPESFVLLTRTGGSGSLIKKATIALQSYAGTLAKAAELNEKVKKAAEDSVQTDSISRAELNSDYEFTDITKKRYRYQAVFDITYMEE